MTRIQRRDAAKMEVSKNWKKQKVYLTSKTVWGEGYEDI